jgi:hypothetical protein
MSTLLVACGAETNASHGTLIHVVGVLFICLHILSQLDHCVFGRNDILASQDVLL